MNFSYLIASTPFLTPLRSVLEEKKKFRQGFLSLPKGNIPGRTQTMPIAIFFAVESGDMNKALLWVLIIVVISFIMIFLLNYWSDVQQKLIGNRRK